MRRIRQQLTFANVVSVIALFFSLSGTALAAVIITSNSQVAQNTISGHKPPSGKHPNLIAGSVIGTDLATGAVTSGKLASNSVSTGKVSDGSLSGTDIADGSITGADVQDNSLGGADIADGSVTGADVQDNSLTGSDINEGALGEVPTAKIGGFGRYAEGGACNPSSNSYLDCKITTIYLPYPAKVLLIGHVNSYPNSQSDSGGFCKLVTNDGDVAGAYTYFALPGDDFGDVGAIAGITGVLGVGSHDFAVDCNQYTGDIAYSYVGITAVAISPD